MGVPNLPPKRRLTSLWEPPLPLLERDLEALSLPPRPAPLFTAQAVRSLEATTGVGLSYRLFLWLRSLRTDDARLEAIARRLRTRVAAETELLLRLHSLEEQRLVLMQQAGLSRLPEPIYGPNPLERVSATTVLQVQLLRLQVLDHYEARRMSRPALERWPQPPMGIPFLRTGSLYRWIYRQRVRLRERAQ